MGQSELVLALQDPFPYHCNESGSQKYANCCRYNIREGVVVIEESPGFSKISLVEF